MTFDYAEFNAAFPWFFPTVIAVLGAMIGSFLNVIIYRVPAEKSIVTPGSQCACGAPIKWHDNIPVLSWFLLRGKARCCGRSYSFRYAFIEALTAALFLSCWLLFPPAKALCGLLLISCLICATFIDLDYMIIPDTFTIGLGVVGVTLSVFVPALHGQTGGGFMVDALQRFEIDLGGPAEAVWDAMAHSYGMNMISQTQFSTLRRAFIADVAAIADSRGRVPCRMVVWLGRAVRPSNF